MAYRGRVRLISEDSGGLNHPMTGQPQSLPTVVDRVIWVASTDAHQSNRDATFVAQARVALEPKPAQTLHYIYPCWFFGLATETIAVVGRLILFLPENQVAERNLLV